jgi:hypothetical protein
MKPKLTVAILLLAVIVAGALLVSRSKSRPPVTVTLRIAVNPVEQAAFVTRAANSARFKYLMGKQAGVTPVLAQRLWVQPLPHSPFLEARVGVMTPGEGNLYATAFVPTLQSLCRTQALLVLAERSVR